LLKAKAARKLPWLWQATAGSQRAEEHCYPTATFTLEVRGSAAADSELLT